MAIGTNSYGTAAGVAQYATTYAKPTGAFTTTTTPTLLAVESWINEVSAITNAALSSFRFTVPVTQADCVLMLTGLVNQAVAELCAYANKEGRFFSGETPPSGTVQGVMRKEIYAWVEMNAIGMENLGAARDSDDLGEDDIPQFGTLNLNFGAHGDDPLITS